MVDSHSIDKLKEKKIGYGHNRSNLNIGLKRTLDLDGKL
jgi:hypothetical protein